MVNNEHMENQLRTENRQVTTMFGVIFLFILGHFLRVVLNVSELAREVSNYNNEENATEEDSEKKSNDNCFSKLFFWEIVIISCMLKANFCITFPLYFPFRCLFLSLLLWWQFRHPEIFLFMWQPMILFENYSARNISNANQCKGLQTPMDQSTLHRLALHACERAMNPTISNWFLCRPWM